MSTTAPTRLQRLLWLAALVLFVAVALYPISSRITRTGGLVLFGVVWLGLIALCWHRHALRLSLLGITVLSAGFMTLPDRPLPSSDVLRSDYVAGLRRYEGVPYVWGGESPKGIDCSGLIRRGLIDALFWRGVCNFDAGLVRRSLSLWWNDCTARTLGDAQDGQTTFVLNTPSINQIDLAIPQKGDLAVTMDGVHIMSYLGDRQWIEADPMYNRVVIIQVPAKGNAWFSTPMKIVRWSILQP